METYTPGNIEKKWQKVWEEKGLYKAADSSFSAFRQPSSQSVLSSRISDFIEGGDQKGEGGKEEGEGKADGGTKPKFYVLVEFPYPSGAGLHVGHVRAWSAMDAYVRKKRMEGYNVLFPMGWDAFGLPAENYAIKKGVHPSITTAQNIANFKRQIQSLGLSFDWSREINTTDPKYYKWTQWIFLKLLEHGLAYQKEVPVNWCPACRTNLADEEVLPDGTHERCGKPTEKRLQKQWLLRITKYADRLIEDLKSVDFPSKVSIQQINWIGRKEGINITYDIEGVSEKVTVFTTRPDTNFGATFIVLSPEHPLVKKITVPDKRTEMEKYVSVSKKQTDEDRVAQGRKKTGVFTGRFAVNQLTGYKMPIWVSDFALMSFGTGAVVGVPGHDLRDFEFAKEFGLKVVRVVVGKDGDTSEITKPGQIQEEEGTMVNSGFLDGLDIHEVTRKIMDYLEEKGWGKRVTNYHLHDWIFSRQHYWGEPIPVVHCPKCGVMPVPEKDLPVELPYVEKYEPSGTGESPLSTITDWVNTACPKCGGPAKRETDTMPNWAGSNWYYLAYLLADKLKNFKFQISNFKLENIFVENKDILSYWMPVDVYEGGYEHTTLHLLYSRFIYKFLFDIGIVPGPEPYAARRVHGIVLGPDNRKMSKSFGNVLNPDEIIEKFGADTLRMYEMFIGPFAETVTWNMNGVAGVYRFLGRVFTLFENYIKNGTSSGGSATALLAKLSKKVSSDLGSMKFNTAVAALMEFINDLSDKNCQMTKEDWDEFLRILAPMTPHLVEELYQRLHAETSNFKFQISNFRSVHSQPWPSRELEDIDEGAHVVVTVDGKKRDVLELNSSEALIQNEVEEKARSSEKAGKYLEKGREYKVIFVPGKLINFVILDKKVVMPQISHTD